MNLQQLIDVLRRHGLLVSAPDADPVIGGLTVDSRRVMPGGLFIAVPGAVADGAHFVSAAVSAGAVAVVAQDGVTTHAPLVLVRDARRAAELLAAAWYHEPATAIKLIGITGTNGKTTTTALVRHLLDTNGDAGSIGTLGAFDGAGKAVPSTAGSLTTPGPVDLQATLRGLVDRGVKCAAMETSSHALHQHRLDALSFVAGVFTNLTRDHLDYHQTMEQYRDAKLMLATLVKGDGVLAVNAEDAAHDHVGHHEPGRRTGQRNARAGWWQPVHPGWPVREGRGEPACPRRLQCGQRGCGCDGGPRTWSSACRGGGTTQQRPTGARPHGTDRGRPVPRDARLRPHP